MAISADGNTAIVGGSDGNNRGMGAVWIFIRSGGSWIQQGSKLIGTGADGVATQGQSVSISADGNTILVGGNSDSSNLGAAWVFTRSAEIWSQQGNKLVGTGAVNAAYQGWSVSLSADGNTAIVGGWGDNNGTGSVWVYTRSGGIWTQQSHKLVGSGAVGNAQQGISVSISADGSTAIVGGPSDNKNTGAAWTYIPCINTTGDTTATACSSFTWYGITYNSSSTPTHVFTNKAGCDSTVTLHLTITQPTVGDTTAHACSNFTWYGTNYTTSGTPTHVFTNKAGCDSTVTLNLTIGTAMPTPSICMVTVDDSSKHNIVIWANPLNPAIDSVIVYRELSSNDYEPLGSVSASAVSQFLDTVASKYFPYSGDPNTGTFRYKIAYKDTCGNVGPMSLYHNTIFATQTNGTFNWNQYGIEGEATPIPGLSSYYLYRDNSSTGKWQLISAVSGSQTTITDPNFSSYPQGSWRVETYWSISCNPVAKLSATYSTTKSNTKHQAFVLSGISAIETTNDIVLYPNPATNLVNLNFAQGINKGTIAIYNVLGELIYQTITPESTTSMQIDVSHFAKGLYTVAITSEQRKTLRKLVVE